jgi:NTP pyrophosphatase (non-canonical NTP hydrolase)
VAGVKRLLIPALVSFVLAIPLAVAACGDDDESGDAGETTASVERYCEITAELDTLGEEEFEALEEDPNATPEDFEQAERRTVEENAELFDEIQAVAPEEIADEVDVLITGIRVRAGLSDEEVSDQAQNEAEKMINRFERENCEG